MELLLPEADFKAILFDCDGTLVETLPAHIRGLEETLAPYGLTVDPQWCRSRYGQSPATVLRAYAEEFCPFPISDEEIMRGWSAGYKRNLHLLEAIEPVASVAREWHGKLPIAVVSNGHKENVIATLRAVGLLQLFDTIVTSDEVSQGKPAPDIFLEAARRLRVKPSQCLVLEDSPEGILAAERAGMQYLRIVPEQLCLPTSQDS